MVAGGMMRRMRFLLSVVLLMWSTYAGAADKTVGVIMSGNIPYYRVLHKNFTTALSTEGFSQGTVDILLQRPAADALSRPMRRASLWWRKSM